MSVRKEVTVTAIWFGAMWGIAEATIGTGFHLITRLTGVPGLAGMVMFPVALLFMHRAFVRAGSPAVIPATVAVAAAIKLTGLAMPGIPVMDTLNPTLAILLEGAAGYAVIRMARMPRRSLSIPMVFTAAAGWKSLFIGTQLILGVTAGMALAQGSLVLRFVVLDSIVNALLFAGLLRLAAGNEAPVRLRLEPAAATALFVLAVIANLGAMLLV